MAELQTLSERYQRIRLILLGIITVILTGWALKATYFVTMPLALAFFVAVVLQPVQKGLMRRLPGRLRFLSLLLTMLLLLAVLLLLAYGVWSSVGLITDEAPSYADAARDFWARMQALADRHDIPLQQALPPLTELGSRALSLLTAGFTRLWVFTFTLLLVFFLVLLMLLETEEWRTKLNQALSPERADQVLASLESIEEKVRKFLLIKTLVSALSGISGGLWLWLLGVDFALLWGMLIFLLNYIPHIGSILGVFPPSIVALLQFGPGGAILAIAGLTAIEQFLGNFVDPRLEGRTLAISPIVVLVSIIFWGWVWGVVGALIGVLLTATLVIVCDHVPPLRPVAVLLSRAGEEADRSAEKTERPARTG